MDDEPVAGFPADRDDLIVEVKRARKIVVLLGRRGRPQAALAPVEVASAAEKIGRVGAATQILLAAARAMGPRMSP